MKRSSLVLSLVLCASMAGRASVPFEQPALVQEADVKIETTLFVPRDKATGRLLESRASLNFRPKSGGLGRGDWDLGYGFLAINNEDWFEVSLREGERSVMKDLGKLNWSDRYKVPMLSPLPELAKGERRNITVDSGGDTHKAWAARTQIFAKVLVGHIYAIHVKDEDADFYALFRVEELEQRDHCTISWKLIDSPGQVDR